MLKKIIIIIIGYTLGDKVIQYKIFRSLLRKKLFTTFFLFYRVRELLNNVQLRNYIWLQYVVYNE
jgi:hypothetical protein